MTKHCAALHREPKAGEMAGLGKRGNRDREGGRQNVKFWAQMKIASMYLQNGGKARIRGVQGGEREGTEKMANVGNQREMFEEG